MKIHSIQKMDKVAVDAQAYLIKTDTSVLPASIKTHVDKAIANKSFKLGTASARTYYYEGGDTIVIGLGEKQEAEEVELEKLRKAVRKLMQIAVAEKYEAVALHVFETALSSGLMCKIIAEMATFSCYMFDKYKSEKNPLLLKDLYVVNNKAESDDKHYISEGKLIAEHVNITRSLVDEPAIAMYPEVLADFAADLGKKTGLEVEIMGKKEIKKLGMGAFLAVSQGSDKEPRLIVMRYKGNPKSDEILGLVGKGLTYDSGGLSIKPTASMVDMKCDMAGAAAVIGAINAIANAKLKINVTAVVAACENAIGGSCYKPGDIVKTMAGKTIFIANTDAEGRLTLVDAVHYTYTVEKAAKIIDLATLTGAAITALGDLCSAAMTNNEEFLAEFKKAASLSGEYTWQLPLHEMYKENIKHKEADFVNTASVAVGTPGAIAGGLLIQEFTDGKPWIHVDIAGPAYLSSEKSYYAAGATGYGVKTLFEFAKEQAKK